MEEYTEVSTEEDLTFNDLILVSAATVVGFIVIALIAGVIRKTFKSFHIKLGDKIEIGAETKEDK